MTVKKEVATKKAAPKAAAKTAKPAAKASAPKGKTAEVEFKVFSPDSGSVAVAGDFNSWKKLALKKGKDGNWTAKVKVSAPAVQYKLVYDGQYWKTDEANPERVPDGHGGENSIKRA